MLMTLLRMSLSGAVLILTVIIIRAAAGSRLHKRALLVFWGITIARLLLPMSFPSPFGIFPPMGGKVPVTETPGRVLPNFTAAVLAEPRAVAGNEAAYAAHGGVQAASVLFLIWLFGALLFAGGFLASYLRCRREFTTSMPVQNSFIQKWLSGHPLRRTVEVRSLTGLSTPLTYGLIHPVILMSKNTDWENEQQLRYILFHEYVHIRRFDAVGKLVAAAVLCIHWFNPMVWVLYILFNRDMELACDESVVQHFGEENRAEYARTLIRMEEQRQSFASFYNCFAKNAIEERVESIMKFRKGSVCALILALIFVAMGTATAFAASVKDTKDSSQEETDRTLGKTAAASDIEWWTYEEYKEWLENEKIALQNMIGERAWTSGRGEFVWTQEIVDESIAMYESILEDIGRGMLYSKTIDGDPDALLMMSMNPADIWMDTHEAIVTSADFTQYKPFGLTWDDSKKVLYFNGQRVRYFLDGVDLDGTGAMAVYLEYADAELKGEIDVHTVRQRVQNADGSFDPMGPLTGLEKYSQAEFDARSFLPPSMEEVTGVVQELDRDDVETETLLQAYVPFGLRYEIDPSADEPVLSMSWQGKPVHSIFDEVKAAWIANSMRGLYLGPDAVDLEAVYEQGKLIGLRETKDCPIVQAGFDSDDDGVEASTIQTAFAFDGGSAAEPGTSFAERFEKYASFGITYEEAEGASGAGNVYYNGRLVSRFADLAPEGSAFTFTSAEQGGIAVKTVYDNSGMLIGVKAVAE